MTIVDGGDAFSTYGADASSSMATGATLMGRKVIESLMDSTVVIKRQTGTTPNGNGVLVPTFDIIYDGVGRLRMPDAQSNQVAAAGQALEIQSPVLSIPVTAVGSDLVLPDDIATITSPLDSFSVVARIAGVHTQTHSTARRFPVEITI